MKNSIILLTLSLMIITQMQFCSKSDSSGSSSLVAFTNSSAKPILDKCAGCHAAGNSAAGKWLYNPKDYVTSIRANISKIHSMTQTFNESMAAQANLSEAEVKALNDWYAAGYLSGTATTSSNSGY